MSALDIPTGTGLWQGIHQIGLLFDNRQKNGARLAVIYANGRHEVAARVVIHMTDKDGYKLLPEEYPALDKVKNAVRFIDYDNEVNIDGNEYGWTVEHEGGSFVEPLMDKGTQPPMIAEEDNITDSIATLTYFLSCSPDAAQKDFHLGLKFEFKTEDGFQIRAPIYVSEDGELQIPEIELAAIDEIEIAPDWLIWKADEVTNSDQLDYPDLSGANKPGNLWRQINYTISLNIHNAQPHYRQSILYRAGLSERTHYRPATDTQSQYCFGEVRQGLYSFRGYLWPNNVYAEADILNPAARAIGNSSSYSLNATGFSGQTCELKPQEGEIYVTLFCSFGWTANLAYDKWPIELTVYDQFGNSGEFLVDPDELPTAYAADGSLEDRRYFTTEKYKHATHGGVKEVYFRIKTPRWPRYITYNNNKYDDGEIFQAKYWDDRTDQLFRLFRTDKDSDNEKQSYKITTHDNLGVSLAPGELGIITGSTMFGANLGWIFEPYWANTSQVIYHPQKRCYIMMGYNSEDVTLVEINWISSPDAVEWQIEIATDKSGSPDDGSGGSTKPYDAGATVERGNWVKVKYIRWSHAAGTLDNESTIFSNGNHQDQINITMTMADVRGDRLTDLNSPTIDYIKNSVTVIDYMTGEHLSRHETAAGWEFSYDKNEYDGALASVAIEIATENRDLIQNGIVIFSLYVTSNSGKVETRQLGLSINITDKAWRDPVTWLNMEKGHFEDPLVTKTLMPIVYKVDYLNVNKREVSYPGQNDEGSDSSTTVQNNIRQWDYEVSIKQNFSSSYSTRMHKCIIDYEEYPFPGHNTDKLNNAFMNTDGSKIPGAIGYGLQWQSIYAFLGLFWPVNILNKDEKPFGVQVQPLKSIIESEGDYANFNLSYPIPRAGSLYFSVIGLFGFSHFTYSGQSKNPINFTIYDNYGNSGQFHARPETLPQKYDRYDMAAWCPVEDGFYLDPVQTETYHQAGLKIYDTILSYPLSLGGIIYNKDVGYHYDRYCELSVKHVSVIFSGYTLVTGVDSLSGDHVCLTFVTNFNFVILQTMDYLNWYEDRLVYMRPVWARQKVVLACRGGDEYLKPNLDYYEISDTADLSRGDYTIGDEDFEYFVQYYPYIMDD